MNPYEAYIMSKLFESGGSDTTTGSLRDVVDRSAAIISDDALRIIGRSAVSNCTSLTLVDVPAVATISERAFEACPMLTVLILRNPLVVTLDNINAFRNTPIWWGTGHIYVPANLLENYKQSENWIVFADQFRAIEDYPDICGGEKDA